MTVFLLKTCTSTCDVFPCTAGIISHQQENPIFTGQIQVNSCRKIEMLFVNNNSILSLPALV